MIISDPQHRQSAQISRKQDGRCLACRTLFGLLVPAMCNRTSLVQVHELPQRHRGDNREGILFS